TPMPDGMEHALARTAQALAAADAPVVFGGRGKPLEAGRNLRRALLLEPLDAAEPFQFALQDVAQRRQVPDIEGGVVEQLGRDRSFGPVGFLAVLVEGDAEVLIEQGR